MADEYPRITNKRLLEMLDDQGKIYQRFKEITKPKKARQKPLDMKSGGLAKRGYGKARR